MSSQITKSQFVNTLSNKGLISPIFDGLNYWCAHGYIDNIDFYGSPANSTKSLLYGNNSFHPNYISVRCVYDEWYWEQVDKDDNRFDDKGRLIDYDRFVWGDMPKQDVPVTALNEN
jgi:hypothetical protein